MILEIDKTAILNLVCRQVDNSFTLSEEEKKQIEASLDDALASCGENFVHTSNKYYSREVNGVREAYFNPFHSVQWMIFLYYLGNRIFRIGGGQNM